MLFLAISNAELLASIWMMRAAKRDILALAARIKAEAEALAVATSGDLALLGAVGSGGGGGGSGGRSAGAAAGASASSRRELLPHHHPGVQAARQSDASASFDAGTPPSFAAQASARVADQARLLARLQAKARRLHARATRIEAVALLFPAFHFPTHHEVARLARADVDTIFGDGHGLAREPLPASSKAARAASAAAAAQQLQLQLQQQGAASAGVDVAASVDGLDASASAHSRGQAAAAASALKASALSLAASSSSPSLAAANAAAAGGGFGGAEKDSDAAWAAPPLFGGNPISPPPLPPGRCGGLKRWLTLQPGFEMAMIFKIVVLHLLTEFVRHTRAKPCTPKFWVMLCVMAALVTLLLCAMCAAFARNRLWRGPRWAAALAEVRQAREAEGAALAADVERANAAAANAAAAEATTTQQRHQLQQQQPEQQQQQQQPAMPSGRRPAPPPKAPGVLQRAARFWAAHSPFRRGPAAAAIRDPDACVASDGFARWSLPRVLATEAAALPMGVLCCALGFPGGTAMSWLMLGLRVRPHVVAATSRFLVMAFTFGTFVVRRA